jgi:hypothetical protein
VIANASHHPSLEQPEAFNRLLLEFVASGANTPAGRIRRGQQRQRLEPSGRSLLSWTTTRGTGRDACFLAKEQSWRTAWHAVRC